jgi:hypothetical protein
MASGEPSIRRVSTGPHRRVSIGAVARSPALVGGSALALIGVLSWPLLFSSSSFSILWLEHLWLVWQQSLAIRADHLPSFFVNYQYGVLYPHYAFYGGTLYALTGTLALALGNAPLEAYVLTYLLAFAAAYGGWYWLGRSFGLGRWWAQAPGLLFVTSCYYLTLVYARGDWPELIGVSMIPLMLAAGLSVLRAERLHTWPALALTASCVVFFGSHSLTVVWGTATIALTALAIVLCVPQARRELTRAGVLRVAGLAVPALLLSAWFLLPAAAYESKTYISTAYPLWRTELQNTLHLVSAGNLFTLSRATLFTPGTDYPLALPVLAIAWALVSLAMVLRRGLRGPWTRVLVICSALTLLFTVMMTHPGLILVLPRALATLQFTFRLESYVLLALSGTVLAILVLAESGPLKLRLWAWALVPVLAVSLVGAIQQVDAHPKAANRYEIFGKLTRIELRDYLDADLPVLNDPHGRPPEIVFAPTAVRDNRISTVVHLHPGQLVYTNLQGFPSLVHVTGARIVGLNQDGYDVLAVGPETHTAPQRTASGGPSKPTETISVSPADPLPVALGRVLTLGALAALIAQFATLAIRRRRRPDDSPP